MTSLHLKSFHDMYRMRNNLDICLHNFAMLRRFRYIHISIIRNLYQTIRMRLKMYERGDKNRKLLMKTGKLTIFGR